jgi:hypothetical protein
LRLQIGFYTRGGLSRDSAHPRWQPCKIKARKIDSLRRAAITMEYRCQWGPRGCMSSLLDRSFFTNDPPKVSLRLLQLRQRSRLPQAQQVQYQAQIFRGLEVQQLQSIIEFTPGSIPEQRLGAMRLRSRTCRAASAILYHHVVEREPECQFCAISGLAAYPDCLGRRGRKSGVLADGGRPPRSVTFHTPRLVRGVIKSCSSWHLHIS